MSVRRIKIGRCNSGWRGLLDAGQVLSHTDFSQTRIAPTGFCCQYIGYERWRLRGAKNKNDRK